MGQGVVEMSWLPISKDVKMRDTKAASKSTSLQDHYRAKLTVMVHPPSSILVQPSRPVYNTSLCMIARLLVDSLSLYVPLMSTLRCPLSAHAVFVVWEI